MRLIVNGLNGQVEILDKLLNLITKKFNIDKAVLASSTCIMGNIYGNLTKDKMIETYKYLSQFYFSYVIGESELLLKYLLESEYTEVLNLLEECEHPAIKYYITKYGSNFLPDLKEMLRQEIDTPNTTFLPYLKKHISRMKMVKYYSTYTPIVVSYGRLPNQFKSYSDFTSSLTQQISFNEFIAEDEKFEEIMQMKADIPQELRKTTFIVSHRPVDNCKIFKNTFLVNTQDSENNPALAGLFYRYDNLLLPEMFKININKKY